MFTNNVIVLIQVKLHGQLTTIIFFISSMFILLFFKKSKNISPILDDSSHRIENSLSKIISFFSFNNKIIQFFETAFNNIYIKLFLYINFLYYIKFYFLNKNLLHFFDLYYFLC